MACDADIHGRWTGTGASPDSPGTFSIPPYYYAFRHISHVAKSHVRFVFAIPQPAIMLVFAFGPTQTRLKIKAGIGTWPDIFELASYYEPILYHVVLETSIERGAVVPYD